ncbi:hypothetical protein ACFL3H_00030 [Gemmatimonadota bacterium]
MNRCPSFWVAVLFLTASAPHHGIEVKMAWNAPALIATCTWSGGGPAAGVPVSIYAPDESEETWQSGETDANGLFAFLPDRAGEWRFVADDGMGHRDSSVFSLPPDFRDQVPIDVQQPEKKGVLPTVGLVALACLVVVLTVISRRRTG